MKINKTNASLASDDASLLTQLAEIDVEYAIALQLQTDLREVSSWSWTAWVSTDAYLDAKQAQDLIKRLEKQSKEADALKAVAESLVKDLRIRKRKLTRRLKSKALSLEMESVRADTAKRAQAKMQAVGEAIKKDIAQPQDAQEKTLNSVEKSKSQKKRVPAQAT